MYKWGARRQQRHRFPRTWPCCSPAPAVFLSNMAKRSLLLLLLAVWVLPGQLGLSTEARAAPYGVKLCGREFIRAVIFTCGGSRWRRTDILAHEATGEAREVVGRGGVDTGGDVGWSKEPGMEMSSRAGAGGLCRGRRGRGGPVSRALELG